MRNAAVETERAPEESVQPNVSGDPPEERKAIEKIAGMLPEFDEAYIEEMADRLKRRLAGDFKPFKHEALDDFANPLISSCFLRNWAEELEKLSGILDSAAEVFWIVKDDTGGSPDENTLFGMARTIEFCQQRLARIGRQSAYAAHYMAQRCCKILCAPSDARELAGAGAGSFARISQNPSHPHTLNSHAGAS